MCFLIEPQALLPHPMLAAFSLCTPKAPPKAKFQEPFVWKWEVATQIQVGEPRRRENAVCPQGTVKSYLTHHDMAFMAEASRAVALSTTGSTFKITVSHKLNMEENVQF